MKIDIDICKGIDDSDPDSFFVSVAINDKEAISFDNTFKGDRVIKQLLVGHQPFSQDKPVTAEWDTIQIDNKKFIRVEHIRWVDLDKRDWCNDEIWETVWEKPISGKLKDNLLYYSNLIQDNYKNLDDFTNELSDFEHLLEAEISKYR